MVEIRTATLEDAKKVATIYNEYIPTNFTLETEEVSKEIMGERMITALEKYNWLVMEDEGKMVGFAYYKRFRKNDAYNHTVEASIYLDKNSQGKGHGKALYQALIDDATQKGFREMIAGVIMPNIASVMLHERMGFAKAAHYEKVSIKNGKYLDVAFWQKSLHNGEE
jgi:phosphinothricin acetyltransferase